MNYVRIFLSVLLLFSLPLYADEGMWPITEIHQLDLTSKGLSIPVTEIYNPEGVSLINAIVNLRGCTASFISERGLILTNHHCAFGAVQRVSTKDQDYLTNGFLAKDHSEEIPAQGYTASFVESYRDVSKQVLSAVNDDMELAERAKAIEKKIKEITVQAESEFPGKRAKVSEMFIGKTYVLFIYTELKDIRMVYIPPISIGEFGGENDNWVWPRHTGDFSFFRAYVSPDGSPADYSEENIPYRPKKYFQVAPEGVEEEDFVFIMGYPGRTYRHRTSYFMSYEEKIRMPYMADLYAHAISIMEKFSEKDPEAALLLSSPIKGRSNVMKNYRGKLTGMKRLHLVDKREKEEAKLKDYIESDEKRKTMYGNVLKGIEEIYREKGVSAERDMILSNISRSSTLLRNALTVYKAAENRVKPDIERESDYMDRNIKRTKRRTFLYLKSYYLPAQSVILKDILVRAQGLPKDQKIKALDNLNSEAAIETFIDNLHSYSKFSDENFLKKTLEMSSEELEEIDDPALIFIHTLQPELEENKEKGKKYIGALNKLHAKLIEVKKEFYQKDFIPDANGTFRLTYGYIRGYQPKDAVYCSPITTFKGVIEKTTSKKPFRTPEDLIRLYKEKNFGQFYNARLKDVPVAILYNTDTTGGNSGSPVLNAKGQLVGVNFDRAWEATINDYAWSETYSRSIAVDIRYVLWVTQKFAGADYLLKEMNIPVD